MKILRICYKYPLPCDGLAPGPYEISLGDWITLSIVSGKPVRALDGVLTHIKIFYDDLIIIEIFVMLIGLYKKITEVIIVF